MGSIGTVLVTMVTKGVPSIDKLVLQVLCLRNSIGVVSVATLRRSHAMATLLPDSISMPRGCQHSLLFHLIQHLLLLAYLEYWLAFAFRLAELACKGVFNDSTFLTRAVILVGMLIVKKILTLI